MSNGAPSTSFIDRIRRSPSHKWFVLGTVGFGIITGGLDNSMLNLAMPRLAEVFGVEADVILWLMAAFMVVAVGLALTWGSLGDSIGRRRVYMLGFLFFTLGLAILSVSQEVSHLIGGRIVQAIGQSMTVTNGFAIAVAAFPERQRGLVIGLVGAFVGIGLSIGPIFGGFVLEHLDWRALFWTRLPLSLIAMGIAAVVIPGIRPTGVRKRFDYAGAVALFITLTSLLLIINRIPHEGFASPLILGLTVSLVVAGTVFVIVERRVPMPVVNFSLFRNRFLSISLAVHFLHFLGYMFMIFVMPFFLLAGRGLPALQVGYLLASVQVVRLVIAPLAGTITDRLGPRTVATAGLLTTMIGMGLLGRMDPTSSMIQITLPLMLTGIGASVFDPANEHSVLNTVPSERLASATALTTTARQVGFSISTAIAGTLYAARLRVHGTVEGVVEPQAVSMSYQEVMVVGTGIMLVATVLSFLRGRNREVRSMTIEEPSSEDALVRTS